MFFQVSSCKCLFSCNHMFQQQSLCVHVDCAHILYRRSTEDCLAHLVSLYLII